MKALIVGTGLIGTSVGLALRHRGWSVALSDARSEPLAGAIRRGAGVAGVPGEPVDVVVVAVPPSVTATVVADHLRMNLNATVMDVASTKAEVLAEVQSNVPDLAHRFIPTHPMAGREVSGPDGARADLFADRPWVICPSAEAGHQNVARTLIEACGAMPVVMSAEEHDRTVALTSHAVQIVSSAMAAALVRRPHALDVSGQGLRDVTRLAGSDAALWTAILRSNPQPVADVLDGIIRDLTQVQVALQSMAGQPGTAPDDAAESAVTDVLERGRQGRAAIPGRHGSGPERSSTIRVQIADEPGALAALFVAAGQVQVNLLDVRIDHLWGRPSGLVELAVDPADAHRLTEGLVAGGFDVRD